MATSKTTNPIVSQGETELETQPNLRTWVSHCFDTQSSYSSHTDTPLLLSDLHQCLHANLWFRGAHVLVQEE